MSNRTPPLLAILAVALAVLGFWPRTDESESEWTPVPGPISYEVEDPEARGLFEAPPEFLGLGIARANFIPRDRDLWPAQRVREQRHQSLNRRDEPEAAPRLEAR